MPGLAPRGWLAALALGMAAAAGVSPAQAAPFKPERDDQVLVRLPERRATPQQRELAALRARQRAAPDDAEAALALAQRLYDAWSGDGDPRHIGQAQAALAPWWKAQTLPVDLRVMRAVLRQLEHEFDAAQRDLQAAVAEQPEHAPAWAWIAAVSMVQADYPRARAACAELAGLDQEPIASACAAQVDAATGQADAAADRLARLLREHADASAATRRWIGTRLAETLERLGRADAADAAFRAALALGQQDIYLRAAYADFLLDHNRAAEALAFLQADATGQRADVLLLRLAIAARRLKTPDAPRLAAELAARFDAARVRGDTTHRKEEARFFLEVQPDAARAVPLAVENFRQQREAADARLLMEAALAAQAPPVAEPALQWLRRSGLQSVLLQALANKLGAK